MRRTIYVGIGGAGVKAIEEVKNLFIHHNQVFPSEIQFLGIDTNVYELNNHSISGVEKIHLNVTTPIAHYRHSPESYDIPNQNINYLDHSLTTGSGAVRSNSNFMLQNDSLLNHDIEQRINLIYQNLCNVHNFVAPPYGHQIDVHICFSLCGGTGSGIYLDIIQKFRRIIPNANIICYAFSHIFYDHIGVNYFVKPNEYASLLEADLSKAGYPEFAELGETFDTFFYISNSIKTPNEAQLCFSFDEVFQKVTKMLYYSALGMSPAHYAINDNLIVSENSGAYDQILNTRKKAWVSSLGNSDIPILELYKAELKYFISLHLLYSFLGSNSYPISYDYFASHIKHWIDADNYCQGLLNKILNPNHRICNTVISFNQQNYSIDNSIFERDLISTFDEMDRNVVTITETFKQELKQMIYASLLPCEGETCGIRVIRENLLVIEGLLEKSISDIEQRIEDIEHSKYHKLQVEEELIQDYQHEINRMLLLRRRSILDDLANSICENRRSLNSEEINIKKHKFVIRILEDLLNFIHIQKECVSRLDFVISDEIEKVNEKMQSEMQSIQFAFELDSIIHKVISSRLSDTLKIKWNQLLEYKYDSDIVCNPEHILRGIQKLIKEHSIVPNNFISEVIGAMTNDELDKNMKRLVFESAPLMKINSHGYNINQNTFYYLIIPRSASNVQHRLIASLSNYNGGSVIDVILTDDEDRIMFCQQSGVIPPYFIDSISQGDNGMYYPNSCESDFKRNLERHFISAFSKQSNEEIILKGGFSLQSSEIKEYN